MQAKVYLKNSDLTAGTKGYIAVLKQLYDLYLNDATARTKASDAIDALITERNEVHSLLSDGITDSAPSLTGAAGDNGAKARYIVRELIQSYEGNVPYAVGLVHDESYPPTQNAPIDFPQLMNDFVDGSTVLITNVTLRGTMLDDRADVIAKLYALWDAVQSL